MTEEIKEVEITKQARKKLEALPQKDQDKIIENLFKYAEDGIVNVKKLKTKENEKRIRVNQYRIIIERTNKILVLDILDRKNAYRRI